MKKFLFCVFLCSFTLCFLGNSSAFIKKRNSGEFVLELLKHGGEKYLKIFSNYLRTEKSAENYYGDVKRLTISKYIKFIDKYPLSKFTDEAKLRMVEFYDFVEQRSRAKRWLDDIIENHPNDKYHVIKVYYTRRGDTYSRFELLLTQEKTAGWALYYRAIWFPGKNNENRKADIKRILKDYQCNKKTIRLIKTSKILSD